MTTSRFFLSQICTLSHCVALCTNCYKESLSILEMSRAITFAQSVHNSSQENIALRDITLTYTAVDLKLCHILNIWLVGVQVGTWQAIHHGLASRKDLNGLTAILLRIMLLLQFYPNFARHHRFSIVLTELYRNKHDLDLDGQMLQIADEFVSEIHAFSNLFLMIQVIEVNPASQL